MIGPQPDAFADFSLKFAEREHEQLSGSSVHDPVTIQSEPEHQPFQMLSTKTVN